MQKFDVVLIHQPLETYKGITYNMQPIGLFSIADFLERHGIRVRIINIGVEKRLNQSFSIIDYILSTEAKIVGISIHWYVTLYNALVIAKEIKIKSNVKIVLGGYTASIFAKEIIKKYDFIDAVINGEGETPFLIYSQSVLGQGPSFSQIPNLVFRNHNREAQSNCCYYATALELDSFDFSNIQLLNNYDTYFHMASLSPIATSHPMSLKVTSDVLLCVGRGCDNTCYNCGASRTALKKTNFSSKVRYRNHSIVIKEIKKFLELGYDNFSIVYNPDDDFSYYLGLFQLMRDENIKIGMSFDCWFFPPQKFIDAFAETFDLDRSKLGITIESGLERTRKKYTKVQASNAQIMQLLDFIRGKGIYVHTFFTVCIPGETENDIKEMVSFMQRVIDKSDWFTINAIPIEPAAEIEQNAQQYGVKVYRKTLEDYLSFANEMADCKYPLHPLGYATNDMTEEGLEKIKLKLFFYCYTNWRYISKFCCANAKNRRLIATSLAWLGLLFNSPRMFHRYAPPALGA
ncbi:MAG: cobalamin B12-binding domain-containing protein [Candidatus Omnitrophica bacterium]|nr:cobalamin B12-binding domain-containing protein [Candidatus Omnitrophota bacterium]